MSVVRMVGPALPWMLGITMLAQGDRSPAVRLPAVAAAVHLAALLLPLVLGNPWAAPILGGREWVLSRRRSPGAPTGSTR